MRDYFKRSIYQELENLFFFVCINIESKCKMQNAKKKNGCKREPLDQQENCKKK